MVSIDVCPPPNVRGEAGRGGALLPGPSIYSLSFLVSLLSLFSSPSIPLSCLSFSLYSLLSLLYPFLPSSLSLFAHCPNLSAAAALSLSLSLSLLSQLSLSSHLSQSFLVVLLSLLPSSSLHSLSLSCRVSLPLCRPIRSLALSLSLSLSPSPPLLFLSPSSPGLSLFFSSFARLSRGTGLGGYTSISYL